MNILAGREEKRVRKLLPGVSICAAIALSLSACADNDITINTSCKEYMRHSDDDRSTATSQLAEEYHVTGLINVDGACLNYPWYNVGQALGVST